MIRVVLPAFNEADGIADFLTEIQDAIGDLSCEFVVVDDCSTDTTLAVLRSLQDAGNLSLVILGNDRNVGHGASVVRGLRYALEQPRVEAVLTVDGDGQFFGSELRECALIGISGTCDVVEGIRHREAEPYFRRASSLVTRLLVWRHGGVYPIDANTPVRVYSWQALQYLIPQLPPDTLIPNVRVSALTRRYHLRIEEVPVRVRPRLGSNATGTTWGSTRRLLPSRRFLNFCRSAFLESLTRW